MLQEKKNRESRNTTQKNCGGLEKQTEHPGPLDDNVRKGRGKPATEGGAGQNRPRDQCGKKGSVFSAIEKKSGNLSEGKGGFLHKKKKKKKNREKALRSVKVKQNHWVQNQGSRKRMYVSLKRGG